MTSRREQRPGDGGTRAQPGIFAGPLEQTRELAIEMDRPSGEAPFGDMRGARRHWANVETSGRRKVALAPWMLSGNGV